MSVVLRPALSTDAGATGAILKQFQDETGWLPNLHTGAETIAHCGEMINRGWVTVATETPADAWSAAPVTGFVARDDHDIHALYVAGDFRGRGIGRTLLDHAKSNANRLCLLVFEANAGARRFYDRHGFTETARSDGHDNEERLPDITYVWTSTEAST